MNRAARSAVPLSLALALLLVLLAVPSVRGWTVTSPQVVHADGSTSVLVTVGTAFAFTPSSFQVTPGEHVTLTVENLASLTHTFTLSDVANFSFNPSVNTTADLVSFFAAHPPLVYVAINDTPGWSQTVNFTAPPLGTYEYVCEITGHFQAGMYGFMGSGVSVGAAPGPSVPFGLYIITGVIVGLVVIAIVLGFVIGKREGDRHEMPPERLGYPEPPGGSPPAGPSGPPPPRT